MVLVKDPQIKPTAKINLGVLDFLPGVGMISAGAPALSIGSRLFRFFPKRIPKPPNVVRRPVAKTAPKVTKTADAAPVKTGGISKTKAVAVAGGTGLAAGTSYVALTQPGVITKGAKQIGGEIGGGVGGAIGAGVGSGVGEAVRAAIEGVFGGLFPSDGKQEATTNQFAKAAQGALPTGAEGGVLIPLALLAGGVYLISKEKKGRKK